VLSLSQEHGILGMPSSQLSKIKTGDLLGILPVHSCLTADLMKGYRTITGEFIDHL
ncbi:MAG: alanine racemase, partial [Candidatus Cloacimonetes bacterium]|nr:alanine racemase [Candidatus Cloacimonadota bacterium]